ncbi:MAG: ATP-binding protein [Rhodobacteraceae bacterium]|nr:ATP-binding protein [Paracoccaceae bacterium]
MPGTATTSLTLHADLSEVARLNLWLAQQNDLFAPDPGVMQNMKLCLNEAIANVISYGFNSPDTARIHLHLSFQPNRMDAIIVDNGRAFDPLSVAQAQPYDDLHSAEIGGFGIKLIRDTASALSYERVDGQNVLRITCKAS